MSKQKRLFEFGIGGNPQPKPQERHNVEYEKKRSRNFVRAWDEKYPGIYEEDGKLYCKPCCTYREISDPQSTMVLGNTSYRVGGLDKHWISKPHNLAAKKLNEVERARAGQMVQGPMDDAIRALNEANRAVILKLFNTVYFILKNEEPFSALPRLLTLQAKNGSDLQRLTSYRSDQACRR